MFFDKINSGVRARLKTTTVRDFNGGWNVVDSDLNLAPRFAKVLDNMFRGDGGFNQIRYGTGAFAAGDDGTITDNGSVSMIVTTNTIQGSANEVSFEDVAHGLLTGDHVELKDFSADIGGIPKADFTGRFEIIRTDVDNYIIRVGTNSTIPIPAFTGNVNLDLGSYALAGRDIAIDLATTTDVNLDLGTYTLTSGLDVRVGQSRTFNQTYNTHTIAGFIVNCWYFQDNIVVVDTAGEVFRIDGQGTITKIWSDQFARAIGGTPQAWSPMTFASAAVFKGELILCNGIDKPILIDIDGGAPEVIYLQDIPTGSNINVPIGRYVVSMPEFLVISGDPQNVDRVHISNQGSSGTWQGDAAPNNGTNIDIGQHTPSFNQTIRSITRYRNFMLVIFEDSIIPMTFGVFDENGNHIPTVNDAIEKHGTISHRTVISLGSDLLMADHIGVPSIAQATLTNTIRPDRVSELIDPELQKNIQRLTLGYAEDGAFSLFNPRDRQYMLFIPKHETDATVNIPHNSLETLAVGTGNIRFNIDVPHQLDVDDTFALSGATAHDGITTGELNKTHTVTAVLDDYTFEILTTGSSTNGQLSGGGSSMVIAYIQTETVGYIYHASRISKNRAWARFKGWDWRAGCVSQLGRVFFATQRRFYLMGAREDPVAGDRFNEFDAIWANSTAYVVGFRANDSVFGRTYRCTKAHTSISSGTFESQRIADSSLWEDYEGDEIDFAWELPWADFDKRMEQKQIKFLGLDTKGSARFTVSLFVDNLYDDDMGVRTPILEQEFIGGSVRGFGGQTTPFGSIALANDERPWPWPARCKIAKLRFDGSTNKPLGIIAISLAYHAGSIYR